MKLAVRDVRLLLSPAVTRMPFRFGIATLTEAPLCTARIDVAAGRAAAVGSSADLLVPKWFRKDPATTPREDAEELVASVESARAVLLADRAPATVFEHWWRMHEDRLALASSDASDRLVRGFGVALLERALMDAACRGGGVPFAAALRSGLFGIDAGRLDPGLRGWSPRDNLPEHPRTTIALRHTVGLADPITDDDDDGGHVDDGLPRTLTQGIRRYGLRWFKIKVGGEPGRDVDRLDRIARVITQHAPSPIGVTVDGNEQYDRPEDLADVLRRVRSTEHGARLLAGLACIEQPLRRDRSFDPRCARGIAELATFAPVIIDEADDGLDALPRAAALGYGGVSIKNCKGLIRAIVNLGRCARSGGLLLQTAEDLTNLAVIALQQDLATVTTIGLTHVERNGHHYFRGLDHLPAHEAEAALAAHPDLYERLDDGLITLRIRDGRLQLSSVHRTGYGFDVPFDEHERSSVEQWRRT